jgi:transcriptional regulator with GAF, ATPase, and Fis domain
MTDNRQQALSRALLQYLVVDLKAQAGAVFSVSENTPPFRVAQTESFDQRGDNLTQAAWMYKRGQCVVMPLFRGEPVLRVLLFLEGVPQEQQTFSDEQRLNLATLARLVEDGPAPGFDGWLIGQTKDPLRAQIESALAASRGVVAQAARLLGRPRRTLWDQIRRLDIDPRRYKPA